MNEEMKGLFGRFLFVTVVIVCVSAFFCGSTTVKERGEYNLYLTKYAVMSFSGTSDKIEAKLHNNRFELDLPVEKVRRTAERMVSVTPLSPFYHLVNSVKLFVE